MNQIYEIVWARTAENDLNEIIDLTFRASETRVLSSLIFDNRLKF